MIKIDKEQVSSHISPFMTAQQSYQPFKGDKDSISTQASSTNNTTTFDNPFKISNTSGLYDYGQGVSSNNNPNINQTIHQNQNQYSVGQKNPSPQFSYQPQYNQKDNVKSNGLYKSPDTSYNQSLQQKPYISENNSTYDTKTSSGANMNLLNSWQWDKPVINPYGYNDYLNQPSYPTQNQPIQNQNQPNQNKTNSSNLGNNTDIYKSQNPYQLQNTQTSNKNYYSQPGSYYSGSNYQQQQTNTNNKDPISTFSFINGEQKSQNPVENSSSSQYTYAANINNINPQNQSQLQKFPDTSIQSPKNKLKPTQQPIHLSNVSQAPQLSNNIPVPANNASNITEISNHNEPVQQRILQPRSRVNIQSKSRVVQKKGSNPPMNQPNQPAQPNFLIQPNQTPQLYETANFGQPALGNINIAKQVENKVTTPDTTKSLIQQEKSRYTSSPPMPNSNREDTPHFHESEYLPSFPNHSDKEKDSIKSKLEMKLEIKKKELEEINKLVDVYKNKTNVIQNVINQNFGIDVAKKPDNSEKVNILSGSTSSGNIDRRSITPNPNQVQNRSSLKNSNVYETSPRLTEQYLSKLASSQQQETPYLSRNIIGKIHLKY